RRTDFLSISEVFSGSSRVPPCWRQINVSQPAPDSRRPNRTPARESDQGQSPWLPRLAQELADKSPTIVAPSFRRRIRQRRAGGPGKRAAHVIPARSEGEAPLWRAPPDRPSE